MLVNNAGVLLADRELTEDGVERTFATNYLGHFLLTDLLLGRLQAAPSSRIVNVASRTGRFAIDFADLDFTSRKYSAFAAGSQSKLAMVMSTVELAERLSGTGVTANAVYPGLVRTGIAKELPAVPRTLLNAISTTPAKGRPDVDPGRDRARVRVRLREALRAGGEGAEAARAGDRRHRPQAAVGAERRADAGPTRRPRRGRATLPFTTRRAS